MTNYAMPANGPAAEQIGEPTPVACRISEIRRGILSGSAVSTDPAPPSKLLVAVQARTLGEATIVWDAAPTNVDGMAQRHGFWSFDARDLPPEFLLEDSITFTIRSTAGPNALHSMEVAPSHFLSIADLEPGTSGLDGFVDGTENGIVRGWVWAPADPSQRIKIALFVGERFCGLHTADEWRVDLESTGRGDGRYGFSIPAQSFFERDGSPAPETRVLTVAPQVGTIPFAPHLRGRRRRFAIPRLRHAAHTTRELVAILTSAEPFPKKVHVIDRTVRRMPDAFAAEYVLLAIEYLRAEMLKVPPRPSATWQEHLVSWWKERVIRRQIRRLSSLASGIAASQSLLGAAPVNAADARSSHEKS